MIDTTSFLLPGVDLPKGKRHLVAEKPAIQGALPSPLKDTWEDLVASGSHCNIEPYETDERDAIQNEARYAAPQAIPQRQMLKGLMEGWIRHQKKIAISVT